MKKLWLMLILLMPALANGATTFNPFTGTLDFIGDGTSSGGGSIAGYLFISNSNVTFSTLAFPGATITSDGQGGSSVTYIPVILSTYNALVSTGVALSGLKFALALDSATLRTIFGASTQAVQAAFALYSATSDANSNSQFLAAFSSVANLGISTQNYAAFDNTRSSTFTVQIDSISATIGGIAVSTRAGATQLGVSISTTQDVIKSTAANLAALGTINTADNPVDWSKLKNVPAGFADGTDDGAGGGISASDYNAHTSTDARLELVRVSTGLAWAQIASTNAAFHVFADTAQVKIAAHDVTFSTFAVQIDSISQTIGGVAPSTRARASFDDGRASTSDARGDTFVNFRSTSDTLFNNIISTQAQMKISTSTLETQMAQTTIVGYNNGVALTGKITAINFQGGASIAGTTVTVPASAAGGPDWGYVSTRVVQAPFGVNTSSIVVTSSGTFGDVIISTTGALLGGATIQRSFLMEGPTGYFNTIIASDSVNGLIGPSISVSTAGMTTYHFSVSSYGYVNLTSSSPLHTLSSCGASPTIYGGGSAFTITPGAAASACTITFGIPFKRPPIPIVTPRTGSITNTLAYTITNTALTITETGIGVTDILLIGADSLSK